MYNSETREIVLPNAFSYDDELAVKDVQGAITDIYEMLQDKKPVLFSNKVMIDPTDLLDALDILFDSLPKEMVKAKEIVAERDKILKQAHSTADNELNLANSKASSMLEDARRQADDLLEKAKNAANDLVNDANKKASEIVNSAEATAKDLVSKEEVYQRAVEESKLILEKANKMADACKTVANNYIADTMANAENCLMRALQDVQSTNEKFAALSGKHVDSMVRNAPKVKDSRGLSKNIGFDVDLE